MVPTDIDTPKQNEVSDFALSWRLVKPYLDHDHLTNRLHPIPPQMIETLERYGKTFRNSGPFTLRGNFGVESKVSLTEETKVDTERIGGWLSSLDIPASKEVYVNWLGTPVTALTTTWETFITVWRDLWYPFDAVDVFDVSLEWAVLFGPEEEAFYVKHCRK